MKRAILCLLVIITALLGFAQDNVDWRYRLLDDGTKNPSVEITARIESGFHLYSTDNPKGGA